MPRHNGSGDKRRPQYNADRREAERQRRKSRRENAPRDRRNIPATSITTDGR